MHTARLDSQCNPLEMEGQLPEPALAGRAAGSPVSVTRGAIGTWNVALLWNFFA